MTLNLSAGSDDSAGVRGLGGLALDYVAERARIGQLTGESPRTYRKSLWNLVDFVGADAPPRRLNRRLLERWLAEMDVSPATKRQRLSVVRHFCGWLILRGDLRANPAAAVAGPRQPRQVPPRGLSLEQVGAVFVACPDARAELVICLMVQEGLRCCEVSRLQVGDIDARRRTVLIHGKGGHERVLPVSDETWEALGHYLAEYPATAGPLVRSYRRPRQSLTAHYLSIVVGRIMGEAGVAESAHGLRHTAASDMLEHGAHVRTVQTALGHRSLATTQRYLQWVVGDLREAMGGRRYGNRRTSLGPRALTVVDGTGEGKETAG